MTLPPNAALAIVDGASATLALAPGLTRDYLLHHRLCPKSIRGDGVLIVAATGDALRRGTEDIAHAYRLPIACETVERAELERLIERLTTRSERSVELARIDTSTDDLATDVRDLANQPPVIRYVNLLVRDAYDAAASDVHLEATRTGLSSRFRIDGVLVPAPEPPSHLHHAIISRIKLLAELDIAERRRPQDGRIRVRLESRELDLRVSTVPTMYGESVVLRLLDHGGRPVTLDELGDTIFKVTETLDRPDSIVKSSNTDFRRYLRDGAYVKFGQFMLHAETVNAVGQKTQFVWDYVLKHVTQVVLPVPSSSGASRIYTFHYTGNLLDSVVAPAGPNGARVTRLTRTGTTLEIRDPGATNPVRYTADADGYITTRTNRLGYGTRYEYDVLSKTLARVAIDLTPTNGGVTDSIRMAFCAAEAATTTIAQGCQTTLVAPSDVRTLYDGPRTDVPDTTAFYLTRFGAPSRIVNAIGQTTTIKRDDPR
jgi:hypothetical protein